MANEFVQPNETNPVIGSPNITFKARGAENIAKVFGVIAERSMQQAGEYANQASKANLLQTHSMLQDVEAQSKIEMLKSPGHSEVIAKNADATITKLKNSAVLNKADRANLDNMANSTVRGLQLSAAEKSIALARAQAKNAFLTSSMDTFSAIRNDIHVNPEKADALIEAQYETINGKVAAGIITPIEAVNLHKQLANELNMAHELLKHLNDGSLTASDINTYHATDTANVAMNNAHLPIDQHTAMSVDHYSYQTSVSALKSRVSNGYRPSLKDTMVVKTIPELDNFMEYSGGAARAQGDIDSAKDWTLLVHDLKRLKNLKQKSTYETGYYNRLNNFIVNAKQPGAYQNFIVGMPEGARAMQDFKQTEAQIDVAPLFGDEQTVARYKQINHDDNLNSFISKSNNIGLGMNYPDHLRQPIPLFVLAPIENGFEKGGDINQAITNIQMLNAENRPYAMNAFADNPRKMLTVYELGNLTGKATPGFLTTLLKSQQVDALGEHNTGRKDAQDKFLQLDQGKEGYSDDKIAALVRPQINSVMQWLDKQPNGAKVASGKIDQAIRYVKYMAAIHNDYQFKHIDDYVNSYVSNTNAAYDVATGPNFVVDNNNVPLEDNQKQMLASHALKVVRDKLLKYKSPVEVDSLFANSPPLLVSSPGKRIEVVDVNGNIIPDQYGEPAYSTVYTQSVWHEAELDIEAFKADEKKQLKSKRMATGTPFEYLWSPQ